MDKPTASKTAWPLHVQEIKQRTITLLEGCARIAEPFGLFLDTERVTEIMRSGAAESFRAIVKYCESQPDFLPEQLDDIADETVTETLRLAPIRFFRASRYKESIPAIREALKAELQAVLRQRKERAGAFSKTDQGGAMGPSGDKSNASGAGPAVNASRSEEGRKRGPKTQYDIAARVAEVVKRLAPDGDWRPKLDQICEALDVAKVPSPKVWHPRYAAKTWADYPEKSTAVKVIEDRLTLAKQKLKRTPETLS